MRAGQTSLDALLRPRSIAVIGASDDPTKPGGRPLPALRNFGFTGILHPVNQRRTEVAGLPCVATMADLPAPVDAAVLAVPAHQVLSVLEECAAAGTRAAIIYSAGFAELDVDGSRMQDQITALARRTGMRVLGPNCQGTIDVAAQVCTAWAAFASDLAGRCGDVAWVSQSGAVGAVVAGLLKELGVDFAYWVSTGNECDVDVTEVMRHLLEDDRVRVVCGYLEGIRDMAAFRAMAARAAELDKPVIVLKGGLSPVGAAAARSHTGALAGTGVVFRSLLAQAGVILAVDVHDLATTVALARRIRPRGRRMLLVSPSGGMGTMMADACGDLGLSVAPLAPSTVDQLATILPAWIVPANPLDLSTTMNTDVTLLGAMIDRIHEAGTHDVHVICVPPLPVRSTVDVEALLRTLQSASARATLVAVYLADERGLLRATAAAGIAACQDVGRALVALDHLCGPRLPATPEFGPASGSPELRQLSEAEAKARLRERGLPVVPGRLVLDAAHATAAVEAVGLPAVAKLSSPSVAHKASAGLLRLSLPDAGAVRAAVTELLAAGPAGDGVLVEAMVRPLVEILVTIRREPGVGPVLVLGRGGADVERHNDLALRMLPVDADTVRQMLDELRVSSHLSGRLDGRPADVDALVSLVQQVAGVVEADPELAELELNPVAVLGDGAGVLILDALWLTRPAPTSDGYADR